MTRGRPGGVPALALLVAWSAGCGALGPFGDGSGRTRPPADRAAAEAEPASPDGGLEDEEADYEDPDALAELITRLTGDATPPAPATPAGPPADLRGADVPTAWGSWQLEDEQCLARLTALGVRYSRPAGETPLVRTPLWLDGPIEGVTIRPRWARPDRINEVMDCRLVLALVALARQARRLGITEVLFYSTYRPLKAPPTECPEGKGGEACRRAQRRYEQERAKKHSQHRRALAIDIGWLVGEDGERIEVLEHYERHDKEPPCADEPTTPAGRLLVELACALHRAKVFNVMLTPNANKAHHNHFHFDLTPDAKWYVIH